MDKKSSRNPSSGKLEKKVTKHFLAEEAVKTKQMNTESHMVHSKDHEKNVHDEELYGEVKFEELLAEIKESFTIPPLLSPIKAEIGDSSMRTLRRSFKRQDKPNSGRQETLLEDGKQKTIVL